MRSETALPIIKHDGGTEIGGKNDFGSVLERYESALFDDYVPFWTEHGLDRQYGGYLTSLDRSGVPYNWEKSVWFQGRTLWIYSRLCNQFGARREWLDAAGRGFSFLRDHCYDTDGRMFFQVTREGLPVRKRRYYFSETFAAIGCAEYARATGAGEAMRMARDTYDRATDLYRHPSVLPPKYDPQTVREKSLAPPMILLATAQVFRDADARRANVYDADALEFAREIVDSFYEAERGLLHEHVGLDGERLDTPRGRLVNPGHSIEAAWFLLTESIHRSDAELAATGLTVLDRSYRLGWDAEHGGLLSFVDLEDRPPEQLEWDMKLWWPHTEAMYAALLAHSLTGEQRYADIFAEVDEYAFSHFADPEYGEWFGYLHRDGTVANSAKGSVFKGMFHLERALMLSIPILRRAQNAVSRQGRR